MLLQYKIQDNKCILRCATSQVRPIIIIIIIHITIFIVHAILYTIR